MILRRIADAIRQQNWFTVLLEVLIVVFGVFIGIEASRWADNRADREAEAMILMRLHEETVIAIENRRATEALAMQRAEHLYAVRAMLFGQTPFRSITADECDALSLSHVKRLPNDRIAVLDELMATGGINLVQTATIRSASTALLIQREAVLRDYEAELIGTTILPNIFPDLMRLGLLQTDDPEDIDGYVPTTTCDTDGMIADQAFLNMLGGNIADYNSYLLIAFRTSWPYYMELHAALDDALNIDHGGAI